MTESEKLLTDLVSVINQDSDGDFFICKEAAHRVEAAIKYLSATVALSSTGEVK